jgi:hypothetical protein
LVGVVQTSAAQKGEIDKNAKAKKEAYGLGKKIATP